MNYHHLNKSARNKPSKPIQFDHLHLLIISQNKKILLIYARTSYGNTARYNNQFLKELYSETILYDYTKQNQHNKQIQDLEDCLMLMKSTKFFQTEQLKSKIFKNSEEQQSKMKNNRDSSVSQKLRYQKRKLRQLINNTVNNLSRKQQLNTRIINLSKAIQFQQKSIKIIFTDLNSPNIHKLSLQF